MKWKSFFVLGENNLPHPVVWVSASAFFLMAWLYEAYWGYGLVLAYWLMPCLISGRMKWHGLDFSREKNPIVFWFVMIFWLSIAFLLFVFLLNEQLIRSVV